MFKKSKDMLKKKDICLKQERHVFPNFKVSKYCGWHSTLAVTACNNKL